LQRDLATFVDLAACGHMHPLFDRIRTASDAAVIGTRAADASSATSS